MNRFGLTVALGALLLSSAGCTNGAYTVAGVASEQQAGDGYCHKKLQPVGSTDPGKPWATGTDDYIDYYGPCNGPSREEQIQSQRRFERFRFGRDYMDEG